MDFEFIWEVKHDNSRRKSELIERKYPMIYNFF